MLGGVDDHLDAMGIILKEEVYCANCTANYCRECIVKMKEVAVKVYKCLRCGALFEDK